MPSYARYSSSKHTTCWAKQHAALKTEYEAAIGPFLPFGGSRCVRNTLRSMWYFLCLRQFRGDVRLDVAYDTTQGFFGILRFTVLCLERFNSSGPFHTAKGLTGQPRKTHMKIWQASGFEESEIDGVLVFEYKPELVARFRGQRERAELRRRLKSSDSVRLYELACAALAV